MEEKVLKMNASFMNDLAHHEQELGLRVLYPLQIYRTYIIGWILPSWERERVAGFTYQ